MNEKVEVQWYTDEETGVRLSIEYDIPEWPRISIHIPEDHTLETINAAIQRLRQQTSICTSREYYEKIQQLFQQAGLKKEPVQE